MKYPKEGWYIAGKVNILAWKSSRDTEDSSKLISNFVVPEIQLIKCSCNDLIWFFRMAIPRPLMEFELELDTEDSSKLVPWLVVPGIQWIKCSVNDLIWYIMMVIPRPLIELELEMD